MDQNHGLQHSTYLTRRIHSVLNQVAKLAKSKYLLLPTAMTRCYLTGGIHVSAAAALWAGRRMHRPRLIVGHASGLPMYVRGVCMHTAQQPFYAKPTRHQHRVTIRPRSLLVITRGRYQGRGDCCEHGLLRGVIQKSASSQQTAH